MTHPQLVQTKRPSSFVECVEPREIWYRYVDTEDLDWSTDTMKPKIHLWEYQIVKHTRKGVWLAEMPVFRWTHQRFVLNGSRKKYAYPTTAEAWESFKIRKTRQYWILVHQRRRAGAVLRLIEQDGQPK